VKKSNQIQFIGMTGLWALLFWMSITDPFFWDGVQLGAKQAWFFYDHNFARFWLPSAIDSGHPHFFGMYLAFWWTLLGTNLWLSHLAMLPFIGLFFYCSWQLGNHYLGPNLAFALLALYTCDPTVLSQLFLLGPDAALLSFFLLAFLGHSKGNDWIQALGVLGLSLISMRGMMCAFALFLFEFIGYLRVYKGGWKWWWQKIRIYAPGVLLSLLFLWFHFREKGWIGYHADSPWAWGFQKNTGEEVVWYLLLLGWRLLDFGRIFLWLGILLLLQSIPNIKKWPSHTLLALLLFLVLSWPFLIYQGLNQHRYLLPFYLVLHLVFLQQLQGLSWRPWKKYSLYILVSLGLLSGHFWLYPSFVSQGWDSTWAHRPYFQLRADAEDYLARRAIPLSSVGAAFPAIGPLRYYNPAKTGPGFADKNEKNYDYYLVSNIMNDYSGRELNFIEANYQLLFHRQKRGIYVSVYGKKEKESDGSE